jgi:hypothetical protein
MGMARSQRDVGEWFNMKSYDSGLSAAAADTGERATSVGCVGGLF